MKKRLFLTAGLLLCLSIVVQAGETPTKGDSDPWAERLRDIPWDNQSALKSETPQPKGDGDPWIDRNYGDPWPEIKSETPKDGLPWIDPTKWIFILFGDPWGD